jgi:hypothetical protein
VVLNAAAPQNRSASDRDAFSEPLPAPDPDPDQEDNSPALKRFAIRAEGRGATPPDNRRRVRIPFLPNVDRESYLKSKTDAAKKAEEAPTAPNQPSAASVGESAELAPTVSPNFEGASEVDGLVPPDTHGAVGLTQFVEVTNSHIDIYAKSNPATHTSKTLAAFFGYSTKTLFDPRVVYDSTWNRWVVIADAFAESPAVQNFFIAVSQTGDANGGYWIYKLNVTFHSGDFWDYPQLGIDQDAVIFTATAFPTSGAPKADMLAVAKARLYNGLGFSVPVFTGLFPTLAPPIVLDQNSKTFLIAAAGGSTLKLYTLQDAGKTGVTLSAPVDVPVTTYSVPPPAKQPGTTLTLDTLDGRFVNAGTQSGNFLWQAHTVASGGTAASRFYQIDTTTGKAAKSGNFNASGTSFDFNPSVAANANNDVFFVWTSVDPSVNVNAQVRAAAIDHSQPISPGPGVVLSGSPAFSSGGRWGDYSAVTIDPTNPKKAWVVNEKVKTSGLWSSQVGAIALP